MVVFDLITDLFNSNILFTLLKLYSEAIKEDGHFLFYYQVTLAAISRERKFWMKEKYYLVVRSG